MDLGFFSKIQYDCLHKGVKDQITVCNSLERIQLDLMGVMIL